MNFKGLVLKNFWTHGEINAKTIREIAPGPFKFKSGCFTPIKLDACTARPQRTIYTGILILRGAFLNFSNGLYE